MTNIYETFQPIFREWVESRFSNGIGDELDESPDRGELAGFIIGLGEEGLYEAVQVAMEHLDKRYLETLPAPVYYEPPESLAGTVFDPRDETFGPIMASLQSGDFDVTRELVAKLPTSKRVIMQAEFDVTDLNQEERAALALEVVVQAERSEDHGSVEVALSWFDRGVS